MQQLQPIVPLPVPTMQAVQPAPVVGAVPRSGQQLPRKVSRDATSPVALPTPAGAQSRAAGVRARLSVETPSSPEASLTSPPSAHQLAGHSAATAAAGAAGAPAARVRLQLCTTHSVATAAAAGTLHACRCRCPELRRHINERQELLGATDRHLFFCGSAHDRYSTPNLPPPP